MNQDKIKLKNFRLANNMSRKKFAQMLNMSESLINMAETESNNPKNSREVSESLKLKIQKVFKVDFDSEIQQDGSINKIDSEKSLVNFNNIIPIPFYFAKAAAGKGETLPDYPEKDIMYFDKRWLKNMLRVVPSASNLSIITAKGNSMDGGEHPIKDGDLLMIDESVKEPINKQIFVVRIDDSDLVVKRIDIEWNGEIKLRSNNPQYGEVIPFDNAVIVGRVIWNGSKECV